eukprot:CAMPEP_0198236900 /NCGR_PEP_ID=MMETSP1446-20131203/2799_1 /TAXON_ID=1461542 ORGANISM="Unidentified sp, Strain CCMP2111" /NCGR_SAMPLE_ID=MMETSP1446 /ASSEMBLY_ACC=CAM_ASM_001112 /LENGTH=337 /DNA_ID=CAMNT_0043918877 /DNA_START=135 /DNA_END=1148 /DNA_ORIENTATION=+
MRPPDPVTVLRGHGCGVQAVAFHPENNALLLSGDSNGKVKVWDLTIRRPKEERDVNTPEVGLLSLHFCGPNHVVSQGRDGMVKCWDLERFATASNTQPVSTFSTGCYNFCRLACMPHSSKSIIPNADGPPETSTVALPGSDTSIIELWDLKTCVKVSQIDSAKCGKFGMCMALKLSRGLESPGFCNVWAGYESGEIACWDLRKSAEPLVNENFNSEPIMTMDVDDVKGDSGVCGGADVNVVMFKYNKTVHKLDSVHVFQNPRPGLADLCIREDKRIFASAGWDNHVRIFDFKKRRPLAVLKYHRQACNAVCFSADMEHMSSASQDGNVAIWSIYPPK